MGNRDRLYRKRGRWYMDLRDLDEGREACIPEGRRAATRDRDVASRILADRLEEIEKGESADGREDPTLEVFAKHHLEVKAGFRKASTIKRDEHSLRNVLNFFGRDTRLSEINVEGLTNYLAHRRQQPGARKGTTISAQTLRHELHALSSLFKRAVAEGKAEKNPVRQLPEKPQVTRGEAVWLEPGEAARLLAAAADQDANPHGRAVTFLEPLLATFLLTGGRKREVFGLLARDVDLQRDAVHFRRNRYRTLKRPQHRRWVPLWPQLETILTPYLEGHPRDPDGLLFPSPRGGMLSDVRGSLSTALEGAKIEKHVTLHTLRHTYAADRIQTTDRGAPVSPYTVMHELGHSSLQLIEDTYGHLNRNAHRRSVVEFREGEVVAEIGEARGA